MCVDDQGRFFIVADGMGGQSAGERASALAVELIPKKLLQLLSFEADQDSAVGAAIDEAVAYANSEIMALGEVDSKLKNMGTTVVLTLKIGNQFFIGGVGDSRVYHYRNGELTQQTRDHSLTQALLEAGTITEEEAENHRYKNVLYRYLGAKEGSDGVESVQKEVLPGDRFLLCSDGVTDGAKNSELLSLLEQHADPQQAAQAIVNAALEGGSKDNISCIVINIL